ncbi:MAG: cobalt-zinc-cadmium efflux system outer membrane protein [Candidatus Paceibacteria bacterium]|jgi:cobalt-zinc-cadmium efflux system outer membrane protein
MNPLNLTAALSALTMALTGCATAGRQAAAITPQPAANVARVEHVARSPIPEEQAIGPASLSDLQSLVAYGLANSSRLAAAEADWMAATEHSAGVGRLPDPRFSYSESVEEVQTRTGPQERRFGITQAFPKRGELDAKERIADHEATAFWHMMQSEHFKVVEEIELAYHDYAFLASQLRVTGKLVNLLRNLEPVVQARVRAGGGQEDLLRLQIEIGRLEDDLASLERRQPALSAELARTLTWHADAASLPLPAEIVPQTHVQTRGELLEMALADNPALHVLEARARARQAGEDLAGVAARPSFGARIDYIQTGEALNPSVSGSGDDPLMVGISMSLPVWRSRYAAGEREARQRTRALRERIDTAQLKLVSLVEEQAYRVEDAARRITLVRESLIPRANEAMTLTLISYRTGKSSVLDLIDSERALLEFELSYWRATRAYLQGESRLRALTGQGAKR